jgi:microcystin-dependent protein
MQELADRIAAIAAIDQQGPIGSRPSPGTPGNYYTDTATGITYRDDGTTWRALNAPTGDGVPTGAVIFVPKNVVPSGYLLCDGSAYSRVTYSALFAFGGTSAPFGPGDGSTTFNVPDYRGRKLVGKGGHTTVDTVGKNEGALDSARSASHSHSATSTMPNVNHFHQIDPLTQIAGYINAAGDYHVTAFAWGINLKTQSAQTWQAITTIVADVVEPYSVGLWCIKT